MQITDINDELKKLIEFQKIDLQIQSAKKVLRLAPLDLKNIQSDDLVVTTKLESLQWQIAEHKKVRTDLVNAIQSDTKLADEMDSKLPRITAHKEYHFTAKHIDKLRKLCRDRVVEIEKVDGHLTQLHEQVNQLLEEKKQLDAELAAKKSAIDIVIQQRNSEILEAQKNREEFSKQINPTFLKRYEKLTELYGHGVGVVKEKRCQSCNVLIPPQTFNKLQKGEEVLECSNCQRILYLPLQ